MEVRFCEDVYRLLFDLQLSFRVFFKTDKRDIVLQPCKTYVPVDNDRKGIRIVFTYYQSSYRGAQNIVVDSQGLGIKPDGEKVDVYIEYDEQDVYKYLI